MWGNYGDTSQDSIQKAFVIVAICCVPLMLLPKPLIQIYWHSSKYRTLEEEKELREEGRLLASS